MNFQNHVTNHHPDIAMGYSQLLDALFMRLQTKSPSKGSHHPDSYHHSLVLPVCEFTQAATYNMDSLV